MESDIPEDVIQSIEDDVRQLILSFTSYEADSDNFKRCVEFTMYNILCKKHSFPSETCTRELLETFVLRYDCEGFSKFAGIFESCLRDYRDTETSDKKSRKVKWNVLECLVQLSNDVFKTESLKNLESRLNACDDVVFPEELAEEEKFDWYAYLQEGSEKYRLPPDDDSDEDSSFISQETNAEKQRREENLIVPRVYNDLFDGFPQDPVIVLDQNMVLKKVFEDELEAKKWLSDHTQNKWWKGEPYKVNVGENPALSFGLRWEEKLRSNSSQFLDEYKIVRELLWIFVNDNENSRNKRIEYVRRKVTVTSLIQGTTRSIVEDILEAADRYFRLRAFYEEVLLGDNVLKIAFSFRAYAAVLRNFCLAVLRKVIDEENIVKEQAAESAYTLLTLHSSLRPHLNDLSFLYEVHNDCVLATWREKESWLCIVRLLSAVFDKLQDTTSCRNRRILLRIFFKTFKVYADMIDGWLTENKLFDWRNEFFIKKNEDGSGYNAFSIDNGTCSDEIVIAPFFTRISECLLNCSQNVEFLCKLNKMQCVTPEILKNGSLMDCIVREFLHRLYEQQITGPDVSYSDIEHDVYEEVGSFFESDEVPEELVENVYLVQAYTDTLQADDLLRKGTSRDSSDETDWEQSTSITDLSLLPVANTLERAICAIIEKKEAVIAKFFELAIVDNYKFFDHVRTLTGLLLIDMRPVCTQMNSKMDKKTWGGNHALQILLCDCVQSSKLPFGDQLHFVYDNNAVISDRHTTVFVFETIKSVDCITLQYSTQWPMSKIFTDDVIKSVYDPLFKLVLKINIAFFSVTRLRFSDLPDTRAWRRKLRKMEVFRHWVALLLQKLRSYMMLIVPQCLGDKLIESIADINNFTSLQESYSTYLQKAKPQCLIDPKMMEYLNRALERVWRVCDDVRDLWKKATLQHFNEQDVARSVELYVQCVWYLAQILKKFVKEKRRDNPLYNLWSEVQHMVKVHERSIPEDLSFKSSQSTLI